MSRPTHATLATSFGTLVVLRDPDNLQFELWLSAGP
jgi:hypothetical protein